MHASPINAGKEDEYGVESYYDHEEDDDVLVEDAQ